MQIFVALTNFNGLNVLLLTLEFSAYFSSPNILPNRKRKLSHFPKPGNGNTVERRQLPGIPKSAILQIGDPSQQASAKTGEIQDQYLVHRIQKPIPKLRIFINILTNLLVLHKVNSVQEACAKCFAVHLLKFEFLQTT